MVKRKTRRPFGFRYRPDRAKPYLAGFNPPQGGPEATKAFATEEAADVWLAEQHIAVARGAFVSPSGAKTLFRDYWKIWLAESQLRPSSRDTYEAHGRSHILPAFARRSIGSLRRNEVQAWANRLPVKPRTAKTVLAVLQSCLKSAVIDELVPKSNAVGVRAPAAARRRLHRADARRSGRPRRRHAWPLQGRRPPGRRGGPPRGRDTGAPGRRPRHAPPPGNGRSPGAGVASRGEPRPAAQERCRLQDRPAGPRDGRGRRRPPRRPTPPVRGLW